ncbi:TPA: phage tail length tape measure family protein [Serratia marcescens]
MSSNSDLDIALRITADLSEAKKSLESLTSHIDDNSKAAQRGAEAQRELGDAMSEAGKKGANDSGRLSDELDKVRKSSDEASGSLGGFIDRLSDGAMDAVTEKVLGSAGGMVSRLAGLLGGLAPVAAVSAVALGAVAVALMNVNEQEDRFDRQLTITGNIAATTGDQLVVMARNIGEAQNNIDTAIGVLERLASTGKFSEREIKTIGEAATLMAELTGKSADQAVASFEKMSKSVADTSVKLNEQYHYLDLATFERIDSLEKQGRTEEAIELAASTYSVATKQRLEELTEKLNWLESAWKSAGDAASAAWVDFSQYIKINAGLASDAEKIAYMEKQREIRQSWSGNVLDPLFNDETAELERLKKKQSAEKATAQAEAEKRKADGKAIAASKALEKQDELTASAADKRAKAVKELKKSYDDLNATETGRKRLADEGVKFDGQNYSGGTFDKRVAAINTRFKDPTPPTDKIDTYLKSLDRATAAASDASKVAAVRWEREKGVLKTASEAQYQQALTLAKQQDAAKAAAKASKAQSSADKTSFNENQRFVEQLERQAKKRTEGAAALRAEQIASRDLTAEQRKAAEAANAAINAREFKTQNDQLQIQYMRDMGNTAGASLMEVRNQYAQMRNEFEASGNTEGIAWIDKLLPVAETKIRVDDLKKQLDDLFSYQAQQETSIQAQVQGGLLNEIQGRQRLVELHQEVGDKVKGYLPQLKELANAPGEAGEKIRDMIRQLELQLDKLNQAGNELTIAFRDGLQSGIESSLMGLAKGTMSLSDAVKNLALTIINSMAQIAAQQLAQMATSSLVGSSGGMGGVLGSLFAATGGHIQGPGTSTSDSIPTMLSNNEYVTRAAVVQQPGALPFLHDFNNRGMDALSDWANRVHHATGGLAGIPAPAAPIPQTVPDSPLAGAPAGPAMLQPLQQTLVFDAADAFAKGVESVEGGRSLMTVLRANVPTLKQMLGVKS